MTQPANKLPTRPQRVEAFANFFKRYMSVSTVVAAALPIPVTALHLIPTLPFQTQELSVYTPLFCFLTLAFIFYSRHVLARSMFAAYFVLSRKNREQEARLGRTLTTEEEDEEEKKEQLWSQRMAKARAKETLVGGLPLLLIVFSLVCVLVYRYVLYQATIFSRPTANDVPGGDQMKLMVFYLGIFIFAEAAFVLMAIKEYLQDYLNLEDVALIDEGALRDDMEQSGGGGP
jgi:hypothetical protein